jgi:predicted PurR-regulated permease PerM
MPEFTLDPDSTAQETRAELSIPSHNLRSTALTGLFVLACFYTLYFAREFFLPLALALVLSFLLWPIVRALARVHVPEALGAVVVILGALAVIAFIGYEFSGPVSQWIARAPELAQRLEREVNNLKRPVQQVTKATEQVTAMADTAPASGKKPTQVVVKAPGFGEVLLSRGWTFLLSFVVLLILLYFLLASGDLFLRKLIHVLPTMADKKRAVQIAREIEFSISRYLLTAALINSALGTCGGIAFWLLGLPDPALWGIMGGLLNFIPYVGAATTIGVVAIISSATSPTLGHAVLPPLTYFILATLEGNFITPMIMGHRLTLNPVVIFIGLTFWGWLWGILGALLAVPLLVMFKIICDHTEPLAPIGEFLGR